MVLPNVELQDLLMGYPMAGDSSVAGIILLGK